MKYIFQTKQGLDKEVVKAISDRKCEPDWVKEKRLEALDFFKKRDLPKWGPDLKELDLNKIVYYAEPDLKETRSWDEVPEEIRRTFEHLGIPQAEQKVLAGVGAQYESLMAYHNLKQEWEKQGVIFENFDVAIQKHADLVKEYFMTKCVGINDHKFASLHGAVFSGGTFIYVPKDLKVTMPLQAYFRMNAQGLGQFEHTLIIIDEGAEAQYIEGCSAPLYDEANLHAGCVEIFVKEGAKMRYTSIENWSKNVFNLNTKKAIVEEGGRMEWVNSNFGSGVTMLYPSSVLVGKGATTEFLSVAHANKGQIQDTGAKVFHLAPETGSLIISKSIAKNGGNTTFRGEVKIKKGAKNSVSKVVCNSLMMGDDSVANTIPSAEIHERDIDFAHEATIGRIGPEQLFYLQSKGLSEQQATQLIVSGFIEPVIKELPLEYAVELNRLIEIE